jgi:hypothetical protein
MESLHTWDRPLTIVLAGDNVIVTGPAQARHILLVEWPLDRTDKHKIASDICLAAMQGAGSQASWLAFMELAIEARIFVE